MTLNHLIMKGLKINIGETWSEFFSGYVDLDLSVSSNCQFLTDLCRRLFSDCKNIDQRLIFNKRTLKMTNTQTSIVKILIILRDQLNNYVVCNI